MSGVLHVRGLTKRYPAFALEEVSFDLRPGAITGFIGRNGAGKSTVTSGKNQIRATAGEISRAGFVRAVLCGLCLGAANILNLTLTGIIPAVIFFPVFNGSVVLASTALARVICGEKVTKKQALGLLLGLCGIVLIALK